MEGFKLSPVCKVLVDKAEAIHNPDGPLFTTERFLVALMDAIAAPEATLSGPEWDRVVNWCKLSIPNHANARERLMERITNPPPTAYLDEVNAKKCLQVAAEAQSGGVVAATNLCWAIAKEPSDTIKPLLSPLAADDQWKSDVVGIPDVVSGLDVDTLMSPGVADGGDGVKPMDDGVVKKGATPLSPTPAAPSEAIVTPDKGMELMSSLVENTRRIRTNLKQKIFGQDNAINIFITGYYQACVRAMTDTKRNRVLASFLFAGPPGVGKTFLAEQVAAEMDLPFMRLDMSEYSGSDGVVEFCGLDDSYKDAHPGQVTTFVKDNPRCVILFDEVEKAHPDVIHLFLQMLDAGQLRDRHMKKEISFRDAIVIFTSNAGRPLYEDTEIEDFSNLSKKVIITAVREDINFKTGAPLFPAALCSRFAADNVVMFNHMQAHHLRDIARKEIGRLAANMEATLGIRFDIDESVYTALLLSEGAKADARTIRGRAENFFNNETYELFRLVEIKRTTGSLKSLSTVKMTVDLERAPETISGLFVSAAKTKILVIADAARVATLQAQMPDCELMGAQTYETAVELLRNKSADFALLDFNFAVDEATRANLNIEDVDSPARSFFHFARENRQSLPIYIVEELASAMSEEERVSFLRQGARGAFFMDDAEEFAAQCRQIAAILCQQESLVSLARENKVLSFETAQTLSPEGDVANISLFDLATEVSVDSKDTKSLLNNASMPNVRFADVIGAEDAKAELQYFVEYLRNPKRYMGTGVKTPRGVLLYGPPGTGKTLLAKAMACESGCAFIATQGNQFRQQYLGQGAEKVREMFRTARKYAPAILFIDEIDAIARERTGGESTSSETEATLTAFLTEMDGFTTDPAKPVFVLAATNFDVKPGTARSLDGALLRRFDNRIYVDLPNKEERIRFINMKTAGKKAFAISAAIIDSLAARGVGMSLAELDSVLELALRSTIRQGSMVVTDAVLEEAFENFNNGEKTNWDSSQLERVARHEAGHALLCWLGGEKPSYLTVVARGTHGGYMQRAEQEGKAIYTRDELLARIRTSLGGRAAEIVYYGVKDGISTGPSGDLQSATAVAQHIVCTYGMDEDFGLAVVSPTAANGEMSVEVRAAVNRILKEQMAETIRLVEEHKDTIDALVAELLYKNHLNEQEIATILNGGRSGANG